MPFRRDCQVCQEASGVARGHRKVSHQRAGILNLDVAGPFHLGNDVEEPAKFMLLGTCTWLKPKKDAKKEDKKAEEMLEGPEEEEEQGPSLEDGVEDGGEEDEEKSEEEAEEEAEEQRMEELGEDHGDPEEDEEARIEPELEVVEVGIPIQGKTKELMLEGVAELYMQLRVEGFPIHTIHTDRGREFVNGRMKSWMRSRSFNHSTNAGEDPKANGRIERAVGVIKSRVRRLLHGSKMEVKWWPMALRYAMEKDRLDRRGEGRSIPPFGSTVLGKKRNWRTKMMEATHEETCVLLPNGRWGVAPYVIKNVQKPPPIEDETWLALVHEVEKDEIEERRRIRGKGPRLRKEEVECVRMKRMLREESVNMEEDTVENAAMMFKKAEVWRRKMKKIEEEEQEVLQTKIVSPSEMMKDITLWDDALKRLCRPLMKRRSEDWKRRTSTSPWCRASSSSPGRLVEDGR